MENIERLKQYLLTVYPVRRTAGQKAEFRKWLLSELKKSGWRAHEETYGKFNGSVNVIAGDPDRAEVCLCAHYDTGSRMLLPNFVSPTNVPAHVIYHLAAALVLIGLVFALSLAVCFPLDQPGLMLPLFLILALAALWMSAFGPANKNNANSNTSGVLALLAVADAAARDKRVCLVFLDNNEKNMLGASAFRKKHIDNLSEALVVNFDCVGDGEDLLLLPSKYSRWDGALTRALEQSFPAEGPVRRRLLAKGLQYYPSDHRRFKYSVAVCACRYLAGLGYYIPHLRTRRDTALREENIACIAQAMARFLPLYLDERERV
ncbi:MAG: Zn-dependent exopeptidase M28 [Oscillospiraceae bacterium]|nr:Zn-dependent exopeptidase M28 [Oscillospiraceae bacterium]